MEHQDKPEDYENKFPNLKRALLKGVNGQTLLITSCGFVSGASLRLLEQLKDKCQISALYIKPDGASLSKEKSLQDNLVFNVMQEYARSGILERLYIVDNVKLSDIAGDTTVREYYNKINELISSTLHMINVFENSKAVMSTFSSPI